MQTVETLALGSNGNGKAGSVDTIGPNATVANGSKQVFDFEKGVVELKRLNIGGGDTAIPGFYNIDRANGWEAYPLRRSHERGGSTIPDNSVEEIYASHVIEHFPKHDAEDVLREWVRVLKPGGTLKVATVDFDKVADAIAKGNPDGWDIQGYIYGGQIDANDFHKSGYNEPWLRHLLNAVGLVDIKPWKSELNDCASLPVSLNLMGTKQAQAPQLDKPFPAGKIHAVITLPRYGPTAYFDAIYKALVPLGIPLEMQWGAFWHHRLTAAMENAVAAGAEYVLTLDYDSPPSRNDIHALAVLMEEHPEADAIAPIQVKREEATALFRAVDPVTGQYRTTARAEDFEPDLTEVGWAHFGLTLIRASALKQMRKPWFLGQPDKDGGWSDHAVHEDISFWNNLRASGGRAFVANHVAIPHMQEIAVWPTHDLCGLSYQYMKDLRTKGRPAEARR